MKRLLELGFAHAGLDYREHVEIDPALFRPAEVAHLLGNSAKARTQLGWEPRVGFEELVGMMVDSDIELASGHAPKTAWAAAL